MHLYLIYGEAETLMSKKIMHVTTIVTRCMAQDIYFNYLKQRYTAKYGGIFGNKVIFPI